MGASPGGRSRTTGLADKWLVAAWFETFESLTDHFEHQRREGVPFGVSVSTVEAFQRRHYNSYRT